jgi:hypothetical protein
VTPFMERRCHKVSDRCHAKLSQGVTRVFQWRTGCKSIPDAHARAKTKKSPPFGSGTAGSSSDKTDVRVCNVFRMCVLARLFSCILMEIVWTARSKTR